MQVTAILTPAPEGSFTALNPQTGTATEGDTLEEAAANLREAVELYLEEFPLNLGAALFVTTLGVGADARRSRRLGRRPTRPCATAIIDPCPDHPSMRH